MKLKQTNGSVENNVGSKFSNACLKSCKKILAQIKMAKDAIFAESHATLKTQEQMLRLALNEAEALAWETMYPHLVFPTLATEKVQAVAAWNTHQQSVRRTNLISALAA